MKIRIDEDFILPSNATLVQRAVQTAKGCDQRHQIVKALIERFPSVKDMDLEDLIQFISTLPNMSDFSTLNDKLIRLHADLDKAKKACEAVAYSRSIITGPLIPEHLEKAMERCSEVAYGPGRPYPPALQSSPTINVCTCNHCSTEGGNAS